jgi:hypothetical protein
MENDENAHPNKEVIKIVEESTGYHRDLITKFMKKMKQVIK